MTAFKDVILKLRTEKDFNQEQLAKALNVSKSTIGMWETGSRMPSPEKFEEIADYFNVDLDYLYGRSPIRKKVHFDNDGNEYMYVNSDLISEEFPPDIRAAARGMMDLNEEDRKSAIDMINFLSKRGKEAKDN